MALTSNLMMTCSKTSTNHKSKSQLQLLLPQVSASTLSHSSLHLKIHYLLQEDSKVSSRDPNRLSSPSNNFQAQKNPKASKWDNQQFLLSSLSLFQRCLKWKFQSLILSSLTKEKANQSDPLLKLQFTTVAEFFIQTALLDLYLTHLLREDHRLSLLLERDKSFQVGIKASLWWRRNRRQSWSFLQNLHMEISRWVISFLQIQLWSLKSKLLTLNQ